MYKVHVAQGKWLSRLLFSILVCAIALSVAGSNSAEQLISTLAGLDITKVHVSIDTESNLYSEMKERVAKRLSEAGLGVHSGEQYQQGAPLLLITLRVVPIGDGGNQKHWYSRKIELFEDVKLERPTPLRAWAATWAHGVPEPFQVDKLRLDDLRADLDSLVDAFVLDYKLANRTKRAEDRVKGSKTP